MNAMTEAISLVGLGAIARGLGISHQAVRKYETTRVPAERVIEVAMLTGWKVTPHQLRPDLYPLPSDALLAGVQRARQDVHAHSNSIAGRGEA
jgi:DNA-binding transcriptional regulator YdaS (Cro superfamily)